MHEGPKQYPCFEKQLLEGINPFSKTIVKDAWDEVIDVENVNSHVSNAVFQMIRDIENTQNTRVILAKGQPGIGKSHLLARIRRHLEKEKNALFVQVRPISDPYNLTTNLYREIFVSLRKKWKNVNYSPLDYLVAHLIRNMFLQFLSKKQLKNEAARKVYQQLQKEPMAALKLLEASRGEQQLSEQIIKQTIDFIVENHPDIELDYVKALIKSIYPETRVLAYRWLQGDELDEDDLKTLGVRKMLDSENNALTFIISLAKLSPFPILLCFDQLESLYDRVSDEQVVQAFFDLIVTIHNNVPNLGILLMIQVSTWDQMEKLVQKSALDRIEEFHSLKNPTLEEIEKMVSLRLKSIWKECPHEHPPFPSFPFTKEYLDTIAKSVGFNPRQVLRTLAQEVNKLKSFKKLMILDNHDAQKLIKHSVSEEPPGDVVDSFLMNRVRDFIESRNKNTEAYTPAAIENFIKDAFIDIFNYLKQKKIPYGAFKVVDVRLGKETKRNEPHLLVKFVNKGTNEEKILGIMSVNTENGRSFYSKVNRLKNGLNIQKFHKWILLRYHKITIKPTWKKSLEILEDISSKGKIIYVDDENADVLTVIKELLDAASAGDLSLNGKFITREDVLDFFERKIHKTLSVIEEIKSLINEGLKHDGKVLTNSKMATATPMKDNMNSKTEKNYKTKKESTSTGSLSLMENRKIAIIILDLLEEGPIFSSRKIAKNLGIQHEIVKKELKQLKRTQQINILHETDDELIVSKKPDENII